MRVGGLSIQKKAQFINVFYFGYLLQLAHPLSHISISLSFWVHRHSENIQFLWDNLKFRCRIPKKSEKKFCLVQLEKADMYQLFFPAITN